MMIELMLLAQFLKICSCNRVVISGGENDNGLSTSVEAYDHVADEWSYRSSMIHESYFHNVLAVSKKLFAIGRDGTNGICEVYDSTCKKFVVMNSNSQFFDVGGDHTISIGRNILVFKSFSKKLATYNVDKNE